MNNIIQKTHFLDSLRSFLYGLLEAGWQTFAFIVAIRYFQADQKYVTVRFPNGELIIDETLRELETEFSDLFLRVHRNALVGKYHILGLDKGSDGQIGVRLDGIRETVDVSRRHLPGIRKLIRNL